MSTEKTHARNRHAAPIGLVFILLCLIGLATVFKWCYNLTRDLADNTAQKTKFEQMLLPVVMFDPPDFSDPTTCDNEFLLQSSLWACMLGERRGSYEYDEYGRLIIPAADVDAQAASLFGPGVKLEHRTIGDMENAYQYLLSCSHYCYDRLCHAPGGKDHCQAGKLRADGRICSAHHRSQHQLRQQGQSGRVALQVYAV